jgi:hypothetical protein
MKTWVNPAAIGAWTVSDTEYEALWNSSDWATKAENDLDRARREWDALN